MGNSSITFDVVNLGHGATDSFWNPLMLDELIDPSATECFDFGNTQQTMHWVVVRDIPQGLPSIVER
jgi:hypothetical protein